MSLGEVARMTETNTRKIADEYRKKAAEGGWEHLAEIADRNANRVIGAGS